MRYFSQLLLISLLSFIALTAVAQASCPPIQTVINQLAQLNRMLKLILHYMASMIQ
jgi:hypothetical protein